MRNGVSLEILRGRKTIDTRDFVNTKYQDTFILYSKVKGQVEDYLQIVTIKSQRVKFELEDLLRLLLCILDLLNVKLTFDWLIC